MLYPRSVVPLCLTFLLAGSGLCAELVQNSRTQTIQLQRGWNSVFLEVTPSENHPSIVFSNMPVSIVASHFPISSPVEFIRDPSAISWKKDGWGVWYTSRRSDAFLSTLHAVDGNKAYLIHADQACTWTVQGHVTFEPVRWRGDSFNHVGFGVSAQSPPTFQKFFAGSSAHAALRAYKLVNGHWTPVTDPITETLRSGEAYWIYAKGSSDHQGPLNIRLPMGSRVTFPDTTSTATIGLRNDSGDPLSISFERMGSDSLLPIAYVVRALGSNAVADVPISFPPRLEYPTLEATNRMGLVLELRRSQMTAPLQATLLKVTTDAGTETWVPLVGTRSDLTAAP